MAGPEGMSVVKQLQAQLKELSQQSQRRNDYMDEIQKNRVSSETGVRDRIANIEKSLKGSSLPPLMPIPERGNKRTGSASEPSPSNLKDPKKLKREGTSAAAPVKEDPFDSRQKSGSTSRPIPQFPAVKSSYIAPIERVEHVIKPSFAKKMQGPSYVAITEKHFKSGNKLTLNAVGSSIVKQKAISTN